MPQIKSKGHCLPCPVHHRSIFSDLPEASLKETLEDFQTSVLVYEEGEIIFNQNTDSSESIYTLRKGLIKVCKSLPDGRIQIMRVLVPGCLFGIDGFVGETYNHTARALTDCEVCKLPLKELSELRRKNPEIDRAILSRFIKNLRQTEDMLLELGAKKAPEKLATYILQLSESYKANGLKLSSDGANLSNKDTWHSLPLSRSEIGSLLGLTIETVSRFFSDWKRKGFIKESKGNIQILDAKGLKEIACIDESCGK